MERSGNGRLRLAGVDEAGRGCLAGPVMAGAVVLPADWHPRGLDDSKKLSAARRDELYYEILGGALAWGAFAVWPRDIERTDILKASLLAMAGAVRLLGPAPDLVLVDGNQRPPLAQPCETVVGGDGRSAAVAAASIVAKVLRDRIMIDLDGRFPGYGLAAHKGYGSPAHLEALEARGPTLVHRQTFRPVANLRQSRLW
ncbi:ribonuclease HII [bacterium]|nr:ribonuclease HII [bacterium]